MTRRSLLAMLAALPILRAFGWKCPHKGKRTFGPVLPATMAGTPIDGTMLNVDCSACGETVYTLYASAPKPNHAWVYFSNVDWPAKFEA